MVANYKVVAETATLSVVWINPVATIGPFGFPTNHNLKIKHFYLFGAGLTTKTPRGKPKKYF